MKKKYVYIVYGAKKGDYINNPWVERVYHEEKDAEEYVSKANELNVYSYWFEKQEIL